VIILCYETKLESPMNVLGILLTKLRI